MIETHGIRVMDDYPGMVAKHTIDVRFIDPEQGTHVSDYGFEVLNYDKGFTFGADTLDDAVYQLQEVITEMLCA